LRRELRGVLARAKIASRWPAVNARVLLRPLAAEDLVAIVDYLRESSPAVAVRFYRISEEAVEIIAVLHGARDIVRLLPDRIP